MTSADSESQPRPGPRAVVVPFGVASESRGLGLGLAALIHHFGRTSGEAIALAQLFARSAAPSERKREPRDQAAKPAAAEAFMSPAAWHELEGRGDAPRGVRVVVTGAFEPPEGATGLLELVAFEPKTGRVLATADASVTAQHAGRDVAGAFDGLFREFGGEIDLASRIGDLEWDPLESVLQAERAALYDPVRAEPHDRLAALIHLGRAVEDSPKARYPAARLAHFAMETALLGDKNLAGAAHRALARAAADSPGNIELLEASAALELRFGASVEAEAAALAALAHAPNRSRLFALVSEARRVRGDRAGAVAILEDGFARAGRDPILLTERGTIWADAGTLHEARGCWEAALEYEPIFPPAYLNAASLCLQLRDDVFGQKLVDRVLAAPDAHPEVLRRAIVLALAYEPEGIARAARVVRIGDRLLSHSPDDAWTLLTTAHALFSQGDRDEARRRFRHVERIAPDTTLAAEAARGAFAVDEPDAAREIDGLIRAAMNVEQREVSAITQRARALARTHDVWMPRFVLGIVERRSGNLEGAYRAFEELIGLAPGCAEAHLELSLLASELDRPLDAVAHAERAFELAGESRDVLLALARALIGAQQTADAKVVVERVLRADPADRDATALAGMIERAQIANAEPVGIGERIRKITERFRR